MARISSERSHKKYERNKAARKKRVAEQAAAGHVDTTPETLSVQSRADAQLALSTASRLEGRVAKKRFIEHVNKNVDRLFAAQLTLALGSTKLYRVEEFKNGKRDTTVVTDTYEIIGYLNDPDHYGKDAAHTVYYLISDKDPENKAIDSLLNRAMGAPKQELLINDESGIFIKDRLRIEVVQPIDLEMLEGEIVSTESQPEQMIEQKSEQKIDEPQTAKLPLETINNMARTITLETPPNTQKIDPKALEATMKPSGSPGIKITRL